MSKKSAARSEFSEPRTQSEEIEPGPGIGGQLAPVAVHRAEHRFRRLVSVFGFDEKRQPTGQVGVLHGDRRDVAAVQELDRRHAGRINPARSRRRRDDQHRSVKGAGPDQFRQRQCGPVFGRVGRIGAHIDPQGLHCRTAGQRFDVGAGGSGDDTVAPLGAKTVPGDQRLRAAGLVRIGWRSHLGRQKGIDTAVGVVKEAEGAGQNHAAADCPEDNGSQDQAGEIGDAVGHDPIQPRGGDEGDTTKQPPDHQYHRCGRQAYGSDGEGARAFDRRHAHHRVNCVLPSGGLRQSVDHDCGRDHDRDKPESPFSLPRRNRQPKPRPQESASGADTIKGCKGKPCHGALQHAGAGNEAWRKGCKKGQSAQNKAKCLGRR